MPAVPHHLDREIDGVPYVTHGADAAGAHLGAIHHSSIQLDVAFEVEAGADAGVEKGFVLKPADGRHHRSQCTVTDRRPSVGERSLDRGLTQRSFGDGNRSGAAMDDESRAGHPVRHSSCGEPEPGG